MEANEPFRKIYNNQAFLYCLGRGFTVFYTKSCQVTSYSLNGPHSSTMLVTPK